MEVAMGLMMVTGFSILMVGIIYFGLYILSKIFDWAGSKLDGVEHKEMP